MKLLTFITLAAVTLSMSATKPTRTQMASNYQAYPVPEQGVPALTPTPKGYKPFHMEHYGRHGSRWLIDKKAYSGPVATLEEANSLNLLTDQGKSLLDRLKKVEAASRNRLGELSPLGHRQHQEIARRMTKNFPDLFKDGTHVDAKSTVVIRCILSMVNEVNTLMLYNPRMKFTFDASRTTQPLLAHNSYDTVATKIFDDTKPMRDAFERKLTNHDAFDAKIFTKPETARARLDVDGLFDQIVELVNNAQSHDGLYDISDVVTEDELYNSWLAGNAWWYYYAGDSKLTNHRVPFKQDVLLRNFIESADTAMTAKSQSVNLRFGHESIVIPLTVLMELNGTNVDTDNLDTLHEVWRNYEIFPMAANIQWVFYRPVKGEPTPDNVLVKILLNEKEATLPEALKPVNGPYYKWSDVRKYYTDKLDSFNSRFKE